MARDDRAGRAFWSRSRQLDITKNRKTIGQGPRTRLVAMAAAAILAAPLLIGTMAAPLHAQGSYPEKPVRLIMIFPPGGGLDTVGRILGTKLSERLGQPFVAENRAGAGGNVGLEFVAKARPDGYTLVVGSEVQTLSPNLYKKLNYDAVKDLQPIARVARVPVVLLSRPDFPAKTLKELVDYAKANPGKVTYGTGGVGSAPHLGGELLKSLAKIDLVHVPYKGVAPALVGMIGGEVDLVLISVSAAAAQVQAGKAQALAVLSEARASMLPDVPTAKEAGIEGLLVPIWYGILAPGGTPRAIVDKLNGELNKITALPEVKNQIEKVGVEPLATSTPEQFAEFIKSEIVHWGKVVQEANIPKID